MPFFGSSVLILITAIVFGENIIYLIYLSLLFILA